MGALQSKIWSEVPTNEIPESASEIQPLSNNGKPIAPFRDPRSISDDVERTPIQIGSSKSKDSDKSNEAPEVDQTPTGPSFAARFKAASIDPRSPGGQGLPRTPIILKDVLDEKSDVKEDTAKETKEPAKPTRGSAAFVEKLEETAKIEELLESTSKMEITSDTKSSDTKSTLPAENVDEPESESSPEATQSSDIGQENITPDTAALIADCRTDICIENEENEVKMSKDDEVSTPNSERCGKKTMFPMVFAYEEAKSPRSPLGQLNLNTKFMASKTSPVNSKSLTGSGDCSNIIKVPQVQLTKIPLGELNMDEVDQENQIDNNRSLVI